MRRIVLFLAVILCIASCTSVKKHNEQISSLHTVSEIHQDIDKAYNKLKKHHPKLYQYTSKKTLDFKFDSLKTNITQPMFSPEFYRKLASVVKNVRQGHVGVTPPRKQFTRKEYKALRKKKFGFNDLDFEYLDNKLWVLNTQGKDSTIIGSEVLKIDDELATDLIQRYNTSFASDGYNTTLYNRFAGLRFTGFYYKDKGFLDSLSVQFKKNDSLFTKVFKREKRDVKKTSNDSVVKKKKKLTKTEKRANRLVLKEKKKHNNIYGYQKSRKRYTRNLNFIGLDSAVAYIKIRGFSNGSYKQFYDESFAKIDSLKTDYLILDLRDNGGGRLAEIDYLYSFLTDKDYVFIDESEVNSRIPILKYLMSNTKPVSGKILAGLISPFIIGHNLIKTKKKDDKLYYKFKYSKSRSPKSPNFKGKLYVLINGNSFSASSIISTQLQANKRAVFVGEETGGAYNGTVAGVSYAYELPNSKVKIHMGMMQIEAPFKVDPDGYGVKPDVEIMPTQNDRVRKIDPELEWILKDIQAN